MEVPAPESRNMNGGSQISPEGRPDVAPVDSPLTGCYLLIVVAEPHISEHKDIILQKIAKGILSWDKDQHLVDLEKELEVISSKAAEGEVSRFGERLIQYASENLVTEVLINPTSSTVLQCTRNLLSSFTRHRHIVHAGYTYTSSGSWILQDGTFSYADMCDAFQDAEVQRVLQAYENVVSINIHCSLEGEWSKLPKESFVKLCKLRMNPTDVLTAGSPFITNFINYISPYVVPITNEELLESSDVVGNIRFSHPTLYVFPGGQGDSALFGINGFNMLVDGGFGRKACFWDFTRHLDRLDAILITRINNNNIHGISSVLQKKKQTQVYPQIGHFFCNLQDRKSLPSPSEDKDRDPLLIDLVDESQKLLTCLHHINLKPQPCFRDIEPINLYHKVGHGTLDMYVLSPAKDSREVKDFIQKWYTNDNKLFASKKDAKEFNFPLQNLISICALLVWQPANPTENITRLLFPGSAPQHKIFEGLDKLKHLEFLKHSICSAKTISSSKSITSFMKPKSNKVFDKISYADSKKEVKPLKEKSPPPIDNKQKVEEEKIKPIDNKVRMAAPKAAKPSVKAIKSNVRKSESVESDEIKVDDKKKDTDSETESKKLEDEKKTTKVEHKSKIDKPPTRGRSQTKPEKSLDRKPKGIAESKTDVKSSPTTPKKSIEAKVNGVSKEPKSSKITSKSSPSATPAKSAKDANNRKVIESKYKITKKEPAKPEKADKDPKPERKPISRRPKVSSPMRKPAASPVKALRAAKTEKEAVIRRPKAVKPETTDSTPATSPCVEDAQKLVNGAKLSDAELDLIKAQELADLKEEQEVIKEIEAVFTKDDKNKFKREIVENADGTAQEEDEEYLIIEKEEYPETVDNDEAKKLLKDSEESEKPKIEEEEKIDEAPIAAETLATEERKSVPALTPECREKIEEDVDLIIKSATDMVKSKTSGVEELKEKVEEFSKEISTTSPEDKLELSSEKKTTDTKDVDDVENKEIEPNVAESHPDEKFSATSGATTAPTLPEDERITLDEIKESKVDQGVEEKYVKEETKEKELPISIEPTRFEPKPKQGTMEEMQFNAQQAHLRDVVKTPDEVADLPMHEEADIEYDDLVCDKPKTLEEKKTEEVVNAEVNVKKEDNKVVDKEPKDDVEEQQEINAVEKDKIESKDATQEIAEIEKPKEDIEAKEVEVEKEEEEETKIIPEKVEKLSLELKNENEEIEEVVKEVKSKESETEKEKSKSPSVERDEEKLQDEVKEVIPEDAKEKSKSPSAEKDEEKLEDEVKEALPEGIKEKSKSPSVERDEEKPTDETKEIISEDIKEKSKSPSLEKDEEKSKDETKEIVSEIKEKSKSPSVERDEEKSKDEMKEEVKEIVPEDIKEKSKSPSVEKVEEKSKDDIKEIVSEDIKEISKSPSVEKEEEKLEEEGKEILPEDTKESSKSPSIEKDDDKSKDEPKDETKEIVSEVKEQSKSPSLEKDEEIPKDETKEILSEDIEVSSKAPAVKGEEDDTKEVKETVPEDIKEHSKSPSLEKDVEIVQENITQTKEDFKKMNGNVVKDIAITQEQSKSPTPEKEEKISTEEAKKEDFKTEIEKEVKEKLTTEVKENLENEMNEDIQTLKKSKSPTPDVSEEDNSKMDAKEIKKDLKDDTQFEKQVTEDDFKTKEFDPTIPLKESYIGEPPKETATILSSTDKEEESKISSIISEAVSDIYDAKEKVLEGIIEEPKVDGVPATSVPNFDGSFEPYDFKGFTTELRETHITTVDSPVANISLEQTLDSKVKEAIHEEQEDELQQEVEEPKEGTKVVTLLKDSAEFLESTSKMLEDIKQGVKTEVSEASPTKTSEIPRSIDVEKLVANVAVVLKSDKSLEEIASTFVAEKEEDIGDENDGNTVRRMLVTASSEDGGLETEICASGTIDYSSINEKVETKPIVTETVKDLKNIMNDVCIKSSIISFLEEERKSSSTESLHEISEKSVDEKDLETQTSKSPTPETTKEKEIIAENIAEQEKPKSKSPSPDLDVKDVEEKDISQEKEQIVTKTKIDEEEKLKSKSSSPERLVEEVVESKTIEKEVEDSKSKSPTPEKSESEKTPDTIATQITDLKIESDSKDISKSPSPDLSIDSIKEDKDKLSEPKKDETVEIEKDSEEDRSKSPALESDLINEVRKDSVKESLESLPVGKEQSEEINKESVGDKLSEKSKSPTPEKDLGGEVRKESIKEISKSPTPEKEPIEEARKESITESILEKSKSPTPDKEVVKEEIKDSMVDKSKSPTPEKDLIKEERKESICEKVEEKSKSATPEKDLADETKADLIKDKSKSPTPEKDLIKEERKESICEKVEEKPKSATPEKDLADETKADLIKDKSKSPTPEKDFVKETRKESIQEEKEEKSKSPTPEKVLAEDFRNDSITDSSKSPLPESVQGEEERKVSVSEKLPEKSKSPTPEKLVEEVIKDSVKDKSKSPTPEKDLLEQARKESICDKLEEKSKSTSPTLEDLTIDDKKSKSPTPEKVEKEPSISPTPSDHQSKSPSPEKLETELKETVPEESKKEVVDSNKSPSQEKSSISPVPDFNDQLRDKSKSPEEKEVVHDEKSTSPILEKGVEPKEILAEKPKSETSTSETKTAEESRKSSIVEKEEISTKLEDEISYEKTETFKDVDEVKEKSKSPTPERLSEIGEEKSTSSTPISDEKILSKSPTPDKSVLAATPEPIIDRKDSLKSSVPEVEAKQSDVKSSSKSPTPSEDLIQQKDIISKSPTLETQFAADEEIQRKASSSEKDDLTQEQLPTVDATKVTSSSPELKTEKLAKSPTPEVKDDDERKLSSPTKDFEKKEVEETIIVSTDTSTKVVTTISQSTISESHKENEEKETIKTSTLEQAVSSTPEKLSSQNISVEESPRKSITPDSLEHRDTPSPSQFLSEKLDDERLSKSPSPVGDFSQDSEKIEKLPSRTGSISGKLEKESTDNEKDSKIAEEQHVAASKSPSPGPSSDIQKDDVEKQNLLIKDKDEVCLKGKIEKDLEEPEKTSTEEFESNIKDLKSTTVDMTAESSSSKLAMELTASEKSKSPSPEKMEETKDKDDFNISPKERESLDDKVESKSPTPCPSKSPTPEDEDDFKIKKLNTTQVPLTNGVHSVDSPTSDTDEDSQIRKHPTEAKEVTKTVKETVMTKDINVNETQETLSKSTVVKEFSTESCDKDSSSIDIQKSQKQTQETDLPLCDKKLEEICDKTIHSTHEIDASKTSKTETVVTSSISGTKSTSSLPEESSRESCVSPHQDKDQVPDISVDSPAKHISTSDDQSEHSFEQNDSGLATERISPLLSGRSTPEIKIDLDVDLQDHKEDLTHISNLPGPSKTIETMQSDDQPLSGKSTPDIAEIEKIKDIAKETPGISTPPTAPVSPVIRTVEDIKKTEISEEKSQKYETISEVITQEIVSEKLTKTTIQEKVSSAEDKTIRLTEVVSDKLIEKSEEISSHTAVTSFGMSSDGFEKPESLESLKEQSEKVTIITKTSQDLMTKHVEVTDEEALHKLTFEAKEIVTIERKDPQDSELENILYKVVDDDVSSPPSNLSSGQVSCAPNVWDEHQTDEEEIPESPMSLTSQLTGSPHFESEEKSFGAMRKTDAMSTSVYGTLSDEPFDSKIVSDPIPISSTSVEPVLTHFREESTLEKSYVEFEKDLGEMVTETKPSQEKPTETSQSSSQKDPLAGWGKPLGLPSPAPPSDQSKTTPKKEKRTPASILTTKNKINTERKRSESPGKLGKKVVPVFLDLAYVPHNGNANYCYVDFFKRIRARYYVFSGIEPSREVYNALLEAKQTWEDKDQEVTIIPTYDTDVLGYWVAENEELLTKNKIDLSPSASRCTINLQDHETSCSAYRLEF